MTDAIPRYPITWPEGWKRTPGQARKRGQFRNGQNRMTVSAAVQRVLYELGRLGVSDADAVISTDLRLRLDGLPRADQGEPSDPGAAVYWKDAKGKMKVMALDAYERVADNLAAVAASLEAMRAIERHGGAEILERSFTGFDALPPPLSPWKVLGIPESSSEGGINSRFRELARAAHPDAEHGSHNKMAELTWARDEALKIVKGRA